MSIQPCLNLHKCSMWLQLPTIALGNKSFFLNSFPGHLVWVWNLALLGPGVGTHHPMCSLNSSWFSLNEDFISLVTNNLDKFEAT